MGHNNLTVTYLLYLSTVSIKVISMGTTLATSNVDDEATLKLTDYDSSRLEVCLADVISSSIMNPRLNIDCNDNND
jgi:hypothetical protein